MLDWTYDHDLLIKQQRTLDHNFNALAVAELSDMQQG